MLAQEYDEHEGDVGADAEDAERDEDRGRGLVGGEALEGRSAVPGLVHLGPSGEDPAPGSHHHSHVEVKVKFREGLADSPGFQGFRGSNGRVLLTFKMF